MSQFLVIPIPIKIKKTKTQTSAEGWRDLTDFSVVKDVLILSENENPLGEQRVSAKTPFVLGECLQCGERDCSLSSDEKISKTQFCAVFINEVDTHSRFLREMHLRGGLFAEGQFLRLRRRRRRIRAAT